LTSRRSTNGAFQVIRNAILNEPRERFAHLGGHVVYMWFGGGQNDLSLPPSPRSTGDLKAVIDALADYQINPEAFAYRTDSVEDGPPENLSGANVEFNQDLPGSTFYAMPMQGAAPATLFFMRTGFEIGMAFSTTEEVDKVWSELGRVVHEHDKSSIDHLLVTVGGPNKDGYAFPAEDYLARVAVETPQPLPPMRHLKRVVLHFWQSGQIVELLPEFHAHPPVYPGQYACAYHSATVTAREKQGTSFQYLVFQPADSASTEGAPTDDGPEDVSRVPDSPDGLA
jgi:hypothetical protein